MSKKFVSPAVYISPININGLDGRVLRLAATHRHNKKEILVVYGLRSNLERWWGLDSALKNYANVTALDLPGLGGMDSFYNIGRTPSIDNFADYVAAYVKLRYKKKRLSVLGIDFGFVVLTRMLQRNPDVASKVNLVIAVNGYAHKDDLKMTKRHKVSGVLGSYALSLPLLPRIIEGISHSDLVLNHKYGRIGKEEFLRRFQIDLAKEADIRTSKYIIRELAKLDNCTKQLDLPLWRVTLGDESRYLYPKIVEQHLRIAYKRYRHVPSKLIRKVPLVMNNERTGQKVLPAALRRELKKPVR